ncbi:MAG TPA: hypothetical protein VF642_12375 [Propionibacteriaceae bacterium]
MPLTERQAWAIAHLVHEIRPAWDAAGVVKQLANLVHRRPSDVALACIRAAADPGAKTPGVIPTPGPHWAEGLVYEPSRPPRGPEECSLHIGQWAENCHSCRADALAGDRTLLADRRRPDRTDQLAELRRIHAETKAIACRHGIDRARASCHECDRPTPVTKENR